MDSTEALKSKKDESTSSSSQPSPASPNLHDLGGCIQSPEATSDSVGTIISSSSLPSKISEESASLAPSSSAVAISRSRECSMISKKMKYKVVTPPCKPGTRTTISVSTINKNRLIDASAAAESPRFTTEPFTSSSHTEAAAATIRDDNKKTSTTDHAGNSQKLDLPRSNSKNHCACFAGELYCGQNCSCRGCSNRPEFQDKIHEIRQEIISRDPLHLQCYESGEADPPSRDWTRNPSGSYSFTCSRFNPLPKLMPFAAVPRSRETSNPQAVPSFSPESKHKFRGMLLTCPDFQAEVAFVNVQDNIIGKKLGDEG
ncbi:hypothetical protein RIF29_12297 [Crotalaria pallida]|uniref:CRC domain-containing protein n=1 Tax=Crotalaria pallida TaxID=3830 RepID=A0AAN9P115_CROPI